MKLLQVNNVYDRLSTGKIVGDLHRAFMERNIDSYVCYARGPKDTSKNVYKFNWEFYAHVNKVRGYLTGIRYGGNLLSTYLLIKKIKQINPDIVHLHCINDDSVNIFLLLKYLKSSKIRTVLTLHAEFFYTASCGYAYDCEKWKTGCGSCPQIDNLFTLFDNTHLAWNKMNDAFKDFIQNKITLVSVSPWLMERAKQSPFLCSYQHNSVLNGIDTDLFYRRNYTEDLKRNLGLISKPTVMYVTSHFPSVAKGGNYILELSKIMPDVNFLILGEKTEINDLPPNIKLLGRVYEREKMALYYSMSDVTILVSRSETFSMPVAESLCCGTPVVGFKAGGPESICIEDYCQFVKYGNIEALKEALVNVLSCKFDNEEISKQAIAKYSKSVMADAYIDVYQKLLKQS